MSVSEQSTLQNEQYWIILCQTINIFYVNQVKIHFWNILTTLSSFDLDYNLNNNELCYENNFHQAVFLATQGNKVATHL